LVSQKKINESPKPAERRLQKIFPSNPKPPPPACLFSPRHSTTFVSRRHPLHYQRPLQNPLQQVFSRRHPSRCPFTVLQPGAAQSTHPLDRSTRSPCGLTPHFGSTPASRNTPAIGRESASRSSFVSRANPFCLLSALFPGDTSTRAPANPLRLRPAPRTVIFAEFPCSLLGDLHATRFRIPCSALAAPSLCGIACSKTVRPPSTAQSSRYTSAQVRVTCAPSAVRTQTPSALLWVNGNECAYRKWS